MATKFLIDKLFDEQEKRIAALEKENAELRTRLGTPTDNPPADGGSITWDTGLGTDSQIEGENEEPS